MYSVTKRISMVKQPYGGYLNKKQFDITSIDDGKTLNEAENIHASLIGLADPFYDGNIRRRSFQNFVTRSIVS